MALTNCKECRGKISLEADSCPHCGRKDPVPAKCIACKGWIFDESKACPHCGDPNLLQSKENPNNGSTVKCRKCGKVVSPNAKVCPHCSCPEPAPVKCQACGSDVDHEKGSCPECGHPLDCSKGNGKLINCRKCGEAVSPNAEVCPHCSCTEPSPVECQACGSDVDHEKDICPECGHPLDCSKGKGKLIKCRKCDNKTSPEASSCPKCNCPDPVIDPIPFVKCRENDCGSIIHKEAKHCPNCGCPDPGATVIHGVKITTASRGASTPKSGDYANANFLVKRKGTIYGPFKTNDLIDKIKNFEMLPWLEITINGPVEFQVWRPAYHYLPFSCYEDFADEKNAKQDLLLGVAPAMLCPGIGLVYFLVTTIFYRAEALSLGIDQSYNFFKIIGVVFTLGLAIHFYRYRNKATAHTLIVWYIAGVFLLPYAFSRPTLLFFAPFIMALIAIAGLLYSLRVIGRLERVQWLKYQEFIKDGNNSQGAVVVDLLHTKATEKNDVKAQFNLGRMYETGHEVDQNHVEAVKWYRKAAEQNYVAAQFTLGVMYEEGLGVSKDDEEAAKWYRKAAEQGDEVAKAALKGITERQNLKK